MIPRKREPTTLVTLTQEPLKLIDVDVVDVTIVWDSENTITLRVWPGDSMDTGESAYRYVSADSKIRSIINTYDAKEVREWSHTIQLRADEFRGTAHAMEIVGGV